MGTCHRLEEVVQHEDGAAGEEARPETILHDDEAAAFGLGRLVGGPEEAGEGPDGRDPGGDRRVELAEDQGGAEGCVESERD